jgi:hypothetical protein
MVLIELSRGSLDHPWDLVRLEGREALLVPVRREALLIPVRREVLLALADLVDPQNNPPARMLKSQELLKKAAFAPPDIDS